MTEWKRNLVVIWLSQFLSSCGFSLALPFAPYYIQCLGVTDPAAVKFWSGLSASSTAVSLAIMAPIWGILADRHGRKLMMLRANFGGFVVLACMGFSPNVQVFILLRFLQGVFTGTINAAMTFVSTSTPHDQQGFAIGSLTAAVASGSMMGPMIGGLLVDVMGYPATFALAGGLLLVSGFLVLFNVKEQFVPPAPEEVGRPATWRERVAALGPGAPILVLLFFMSTARSFDGPILPLFVQQIHGRLEGAARWAGLLNGVAAVGTVLAGVYLGRLADRVAPPLIGRLSALGAAVFMALTGIFPFFAVLLPVRFLLAFCAGGLDPVFQVWLSRITPEARRGTIFGWSVTAKSIGWAIAPMLSGVSAMYCSMPVVFLIGTGLYLIVIPMVGSVSRRVLRAT
jgi:DHA1 family multidrug resistance protein-like MFS transporter